MTPRRNTQDQIDTIAAGLQALKDQFDEKSKVSDENHKMLSVMYAALMVAQPGQGGKALLERMADVTVQIESGKRTANSIVIFAKWFAAIGAIVGLLTSMRLGLWTKG